MRAIAMIFLIAAAVCITASAQTTMVSNAGTTSAVLRVRMPLESAESMLKQRGAKPCPLQVMSRTPDGKEIRYYRLKNHPDIRIIASHEQSGILIESLAIQTYTSRRAWESKMDPEREKYFQSFKNVHEYDLEKQPNQQIQPIAGKPGSG